MNDSVKKPVFEVLACDDTELGLLILRRRELIGRRGTIVTEITLNHEFLMSDYLTLSERALARSALSRRDGSGLRVLVGGLGLGYTANEVLVAGGDRVASVEVVEFLPEVIGWMDAGLVPLAGALNADPRLTVVRGDIYARLAEVPADTYDVILIDVDHSPEDRLGGGSAHFYAEAGLRRAREHLSESGVLAVWSYAEDSPFASAMREVFGDVHAEPVTVENDLVDEEQTDWLFIARRRDT